MRNSVYHLVGFVFVFFLLSWVEVAEIPKPFQKKIDKAIIEFWTEPGELSGIEMVETKGEEAKKVGVRSVHVLTHANAISGYVVLAVGRSKFENFDYAIFYDAKKNIKGVRVLTYREDHGGEISSKRWLRQFEGKTVQSPLQVGNDIQGISGATISYLAITKGVKEITLIMQEI